MVAAASLRGTVNLPAAALTLLICADIFIEVPATLLLRVFIASEPIFAPSITLDMNVVIAANAPNLTNPAAAVFHAPNVLTPAALASLNIFADLPMSPEIWFITSPTKGIALVILAKSSNADISLGVAFATSSMALETPSAAIIV